MAQNGGYGSREMAKAFLNAMKQDRVDAYSTQASYLSHAREFQQFMKNEFGVRFSEKVKMHHVEEYGEYIRDRVLSGEIGTATGQQKLSVVNQMLETLNGNDKLRISPSYYAGERSFIREVENINSRESVNKFMDYLIDKEHPLAERFIAIQDLESEFGARNKEAQLFNPGLYHDREGNLTVQIGDKITLSEGTKGGRDRAIEITNEAQLEALKSAYAAQQGDGRAGQSMIPADMSLAQFKQSYNNAKAAASEKYGGEIIKDHAFRSEFAVREFEKRAEEKIEALGGEGGLDAPVRYTGAKGQYFEEMSQRTQLPPEVINQVYKDARLEVSELLGHSREDVLNAYIGSGHRV